MLAFQVRELRFRDVQQFPSFPKLENDETGIWTKSCVMWRRGGWKPWRVSWSSNRTGDKSSSLCPSTRSPIRFPWPAPLQFDPERKSWKDPEVNGTFSVTTCNSQGIENPAYAMESELLVQQFQSSGICGFKYCLQGFNLRHQDPVSTHLCRLLTSWVFQDFGSPVFFLSSLKGTRLSSLQWS